VIVVDASLIFHLIVDGPKASEAIEALEKQGTMVAPQLIDLEILNALRKQRMANRVSRERIEQALGDFNAIAIERYPTHHLNTRIWELCDNLTPYDACYVALAESLEIPLYSLDRRMANAPRHNAQIIIV
jgi:predicted nucleic acid-binding protein